jgi:hypothetical protein
MTPTKKFELMTESEKYEHCEKILNTYPSDHPDRLKGLRMIEAWKPKKGSARDEK